MGDFLTKQKVSFTRRAACAGAFACFAVSAGLSVTGALADPAGRAALILSEDGLGDAGWNDLAWLGLKQAKEEGLVDDIDVFTSNPTEILGLFTSLASAGQHDLIISNDWNYSTALAQTANAFPNQNFAAMDSMPAFEDGDIGKDGTMTVLYSQEQVSALAGAAAAFAAIEKGGSKVGLVLGMEFSILHDFEVGFKFGVQWAADYMAANKADLYNASAFAATDPTERVLWTYTGTFADPAIGKSATTVQLEQGASVVYQVAGGTGIGVLTGVGDYHRDNNIPFTELPWSIGVDAAQEWIDPSVLVSAMKRQDRAARDLIEMVANGTFRDDIANNNGVMLMSLTNNGVKLSNPEILQESMEAAVAAGKLDQSKMDQILAEYTQLRASLSKESWSAISDLETKIMSGEIVVPKPSADPVKWDIQALREELG